MAELPVERRTITVRGALPHEWGAAAGGRGVLLTERSRGRSVSFGLPQRSVTITGGLMAIAANAVAMTAPPWTDSGVINRRTASNPIASTMTIRAAAFTSAARMPTR